MTVNDFWEILEMLDWNFEGEDHRVINPVVQYLAAQSDERIFEFDDIMSKLLSDLDKPELAEQLYGMGESVPEDDFLYTRCVALINGKEYYEAVLYKRESLQGDMEFQPILYVPAIAWALKHGGQGELYPHAAVPGYKQRDRKGRRDN